MERRRLASLPSGVLLIVTLFAAAPAYGGSETSDVQGMAQAVEVDAVSTPDLPEGATEAVREDSEPPSQRYSLSYFNIFYGPALKNTTSYQATPTGEVDTDRPILFKNFLTAGYHLTDDLTVSATGQWVHQPVRGQELSLRDPYAKIAHSSVFSSHGVTLSGDIRAHFPVTMFSRESDLRAAFQSFQALSWDPEGSSWSLAGFFSERWNFFGSQGVGNDGDFYFAPYLAYQLRPSLALTVMYEVMASHVLYDDAWRFTQEGTDLEPGVSWDITPNFNLSPYLHFFPGGRISWETTSIGMLLSWKLI